MVWLKSSSSPFTNKNMNITQTALRSTLFLKAVALILGFLFWNVLSDSFLGSYWVTMPLAFYNRTSEKIEAPEKIRVELKGKRSHLKNLDTSSLALHIDVQTLSQGPQTLEITSDLLFLPATISVGESVPCPLIIFVTKGTP